MAVRRFALGVHNFAQPVDLVIDFGRAGFSFLVFPVRRDAVFRDAVHFVRADLDFKSFLELCDNRRVQRLISVGFRHCDIVLETPRERHPHRVNRAKHRITILHLVDDDADCGYVVNLLDILPLFQHFFVNAVKVFLPAVDLALNAEFLKFRFQLVANFLDKLLAFFGFRLYKLDKFVIIVGIKITHRKVFQLALDET